MWGLVENPEDRFSHNEAHTSNLLRCGPVTVSMCYKLSDCLFVKTKGRIKFAHSMCRYSLHYINLSLA